MGRPSIAFRSPFFRSATQAAVLHRLAREPGTWLTMSDFADVDAPSISVRRELAILTSAGIVERQITMRPHRYRLPLESPVTEHLVALINVTIGVELQLTHELQRLDDVVGAAIFGSWATAQVTPTSDIDVLVVLRDGAPVSTVDDVRDAARRVESSIGRDVDVMVYTRAELVEKYESGSGFLRGVLDGKLIDLVGHAAGIVEPDRVAT
jgi:predicted nucleotidyltransferase